MTVRQKRKKRIEQKVADKSENIIGNGVEYHSRKLFIGKGKGNEYKHKGDKTGDDKEVFLDSHNIPSEGKVSSIK